MRTTVPINTCAKRYVEGESLAEIAQNTYYHPTTIRAALIKAGIPMRKRGPREARTLKLQVRVHNAAGNPIGRPQQIDMEESDIWQTIHQSEGVIGLRDRLYVTIRKVT